MPGTNRPPDHLRCTFIKQNGNRCAQERVDLEDPDCTLCHFHVTMVGRQEGNLPAKVKAQYANAIMSVSPMQVLLDEVQRTQMMVLWLESCIAEKETQDLTQAITSESRDGGPGGGFTSEKVEDRLSALFVAYQGERHHLANVTRMALQSGIEEKQLELNQQLASTVLTAMMSFARLAGQDPTSAVVKQWMAESLKAAQAGRIIEGDPVVHEGSSQGREPGLALPPGGQTTG